jgi:hypothetical protein
MPLTIDPAPLPAILTSGANAATGPTETAGPDVDEPQTGCGEHADQVGSEAPARDEMWSRWA